MKAGLIFMSLVLTAPALAFAQEHDHAGSQAAAPPLAAKPDATAADAATPTDDAAAAIQGKGRVLYYKNPMGGSDTSPVPKKDSMGMDYIAVYDGDAPPVVTDYAADRYYDPQSMAQARALLKSEHGGEPVSLVAVNILELQTQNGKDGYRWDGEAWYGGDTHRAVIKFKGEGEFNGAPGDAELQALYARPIGPYFNLLAGLRYDIEPKPSRGYATVGFEGLAPYWFDVSGALFVSEKGDLHARLEGYYDLNVTQRLILQPRAEIDVAAQDVPELKTGAGITTVEAELRLRYEIQREFAPYVGVTLERKVGETATRARAAGDHVGTTRFVAGVRLLF